MMAQGLRVGIIGASARGGAWAEISHVPAVKGLAGLELVAVAASSQEAANQAAKMFGAARGYGEANDLIRDPDVDLVTVAVKVPDHRALVLEALQAGKHVFCEWPLGRDVAEAEELTRAAGSAGVHAAIGLQARLSPAVRRARELVASDTIGRVLAARHYSDTMAFGPAATASALYLEEPANGATHLAIHGGHALDLGTAVLGSFADVTALNATQFPEIEVGEKGERRPRRIPDRMLALARVETGAALSLEVIGGRPAKATTFRLEVVGETGMLVLAGGAARGFQAGRIALTLNGKDQAVEEGELTDLPDTAFNVAAVYAALRDDIADNTANTPDFAHAVRLTRLVEAVTQSSEDGTRKAAAGWPSA